MPQTACRGPGPAALAPVEFSNGVELYDADLGERATASVALVRVGRGTVNSFGFDNPQANVQVNYVYTKLKYVDGTGGDFHGRGCRVHLDF